MTIQPSDDLAFAARSTFSLQNQALRAVWGLAHALFFRFSPRPLFFWRRWLLRLFGAEIGAGARVYGCVKIWAPWRLKLGQAVWVGEGARLYNIAMIEAEDGAVISQGAHLCTGSRDYQSPAFDLISAPIILKRRAWVATEAFVGPGVILGEGAVAAARAVVTRTIAPGDVVAGNPAKIIKSRLQAEMRQV